MGHCQVSTVALLLVLATSAASFGKASSQANPCSSLGFKFYEKGIVRPSEVKACFRMFPYNRRQAQRTLETMKRVLVDIYPYVNIAIKSPSPQLRLAVQLRARLAKINATKYRYDYEFHMALHRLVKSLNDGHTRWEPKCYVGTSISVNAFPLVQVYNTSTKQAEVLIFPIPASPEIIQQNAYLGLATQYTKKLTGVNASDYAGAQVVRINNVPVLEYVEQVARAAGRYRDQQARINALFVRPQFGRGQFNYGFLCTPERIPSQDVVTYDVIRPGRSEVETLTVPWLAFYTGKPFSDHLEYYALNCYQDPLAVAAQAQARLQNGQASRAERSYRGNVPWKQLTFTLDTSRFTELAPVASTANVAQATVTLLSNETEFVKVHLLPDGITGVMTIPDFAGPQNIPGVDPLIGLLTSFETGRALLRKAGTTRLIIDVSNNGGGSVIASAFVIESLFPRTKFALDQDQFKAPIFAQQAVRSANKLKVDNAYYYNATSYRYSDLSNNPLNSSDGFFFPLVNITQNDVTDTFSRRFIQGYPRELLNGINRTQFQYDPANVLVLTNGLCYSTCSIMTTTLQRELGVRVVVAGGRQNNGTFAHSAGFVGFVVTNFNDNFWSTVVYPLKLQGGQYSPKLLTVQGTLAFTIAQSYTPTRLTTPAEFVYAPGDIHVPFTNKNVLWPSVLWTEVAAFF